MRDKIVAGNWKMNNNLPESITLLEALKQNEMHSEVKVMVAPSFPLLFPVKEMLKDSAIEVIAQNCNAHKQGAHTGEVAASMLTSIGVRTVIIGHSERRHLYNESDDLLADKVNTALEESMQIIFCVGEELEDRKANRQNETIKSQLKNSLFHLSAEQMKKVIIAYEPVWAIGTGETATPEQAQEMHQYIRQQISERFDADLSENTSILYGGSVKPNNAKELFSKPDVDGGLIGGASLKADDFTAIINAF
ncbi:triose-phosphate isomerase [Mesonia sp. HuA40]|uniref:triose-phosphate isomerase n=1 Tax=Mesonia sp. HuA40 TaxID=2602761 RepID=UPI0011C93AC0|nr:triose-phosphate isomerase [Mesonia sp. HuA40]TXK75252.1 triose-phosphate isomerase [Mesonia sp. HuA40]